MANIHASCCRVHFRVFPVDSYNGFAFYMWSLMTFISPRNERAKFSHGPRDGPVPERFVAVMVSVPVALFSSFILNPASYDAFSTSLHNWFDSWYLIAYIKTSSRCIVVFLPSRFPITCSMKIWKIRGGILELERHPVYIRRCRGYIGAVLWMSDSGARIWK